MSIIQAIQNSHQNEKYISQSINQVTFDEHTLLVVNHPACKATVSLQGAHLVYWQPSSEKTPVIWLSEKSFFKKETPIRGGIPICWPWFGKVNTPAHGFARIVDWQLSANSEDETGVNLVLSLQDNEQTKKYWPNAFALELKLHLGSNCKVELSCQGNFTATSALHTYFGVNDISDVVVKGLGEVYEERLKTQNEPKKVGEMTFDQEVDRIYTQAKPVITIKDALRKIQLTSFNYSDVVTWNCGAKNSKTVQDFADDSYKNYVCVETCRVNKPIESTADKTSSYGFEIDLIK